MAERYIRGIYAADVFCGLVVRSSKLPMDEHDKRVVRRDMIDALEEFLVGLEIGTTYQIRLVFHVKLAKLRVLSKLFPKAQEGSVINVGRMDGMLKRIDGELFMYNERVADSTPPALPPGTDVPNG